MLTLIETLNKTLNKAYDANCVKYASFNQEWHILCQFFICWHIKCLILINYVSKTMDTSKCQVSGHIFFTVQTQNLKIREISIYVHFAIKWVGFYQ